MLASIRYQNFKRYSDATLNLTRPITILVGPNSSGKSSLLKGLLAFKQTYDDPTDHAGFVAEGEYVDIGHFEEYVRNHDTRLPVTFTFRVLDLPRLYYRSANSRRFRSADISITHEEDPQTKHGRVTEYKLKLNLDSEGENQDDYSITYSRMQKAEEYYKLDVSEALFSFGINLGFKTPVDSASVRSKYDYLRVRMQRGDIQAVRDNQQGMVLRTVRGAYDEAIDAITSLERFIVQPIHSELFSELTKSVFALASLRAKPSRSVKRTDERGNVGSAGQNTGSVYFSLRQRSAKSNRGNSRLRETVDRLHEWFQRLKLGATIEINSWRDLIDMRTTVDAKNKRSDSVVDIGVGFSQAAPILVQMAAMPDNAILITEQPELHLYPWAQTKLGEIFCEEAARGNKRIFIETHSEHLIQGVQLHLSKHRNNKTGLGPKDIQVVYIDREHGVRQLELDEFGEFRTSWPEGFFDQTLRVYQEMLQNKLK